MRYLTFLFLFFSSFINGQKTYPYLYQDSVGHEFIVLTLEQAQKLDNATEFSPVLFKDNMAYYKLVDSIYNQKIKTAINEVVNVKDDEISIINKKYAETKIYGDSLRIIIDNQKTEISELEKKDIENIENITTKIDEIEELKTSLKIKEIEIIRHKRNTKKAIIFGVISFTISIILNF